MEPTTSIYQVVHKYETRNPIRCLHIHQIFEHLLGLKKTPFTFTSIPSMVFLNTDPPIQNYRQFFLSSQMNHINNFKKYINSVDSVERKRVPS